MRFVFLLAFALLIIPTSNGQNDVEVSTNYGTISGFHNDETGLNYFLGVPYAQPPIDSLRWKAPQELKSWSKTKQTKKFASSAIQTNVFGDMIYRSEDKSEDCLYLNIWSPKIDNDEKLPVLVYFYGGGFVAGDGSEPRYDGAALAQQGIITVTVNYRLNIFGFFAHPRLSEEAEYGSSGNYGLLDQAMALKWVNENIENFGGDPEKITIGGESAGSVSVSAQMASPLSKDYLAGAIGESGASFGTALPAVTMDEAENTGVEFLKKVGYKFEDFRELPADSIYKIFQKSGRFGFPIVTDGYFLPKEMSKIYGNGEQANIPLLVGWNSAEMNGQAVMQNLEMTTENLQKKIKELYPEDSEKAMKLYNPQSEEEVVNVATDLASDRFISYSTWKWFDLHRKNSDKQVYRYFFKRIRPSDPASNYKPVGAAHASEIEYFLGNLSKEQFPYLTETDFDISEKIQKYMVNFIKTGNPNSEGLKEWPSAKEGENPSVMVFDKEFEVIESNVEDRYRFLDKQ